MCTLRASTDSLRSPNQDQERLRVVVHHVKMEIQSDAGMAERTASSQSLRISGKAIAGGNAKTGCFTTGEVAESHIQSLLACYAELSRLPCLEPQTAVDAAFDKLVQVCRSRVTDEALATVGRTHTSQQKTTPRSER